MSEIIPFGPLVDAKEPVRPVPSTPVAPVIRTDCVYVVFTTIPETLAAVRIADALAKAMAAKLTLIHFRAVPFPLSVEQPAGLSPVETQAFADELRTQGFDVQVRVYLCRSEWRGIPWAFYPRSLVVVGGAHTWWPRLSERWRRRLEAAGHFVLFVDADEHVAAAPDSRHSRTGAASE